MSRIPRAGVEPPAVSAQAMRRMDRWATSEFHLPLLVMMEHAGRALAELVVRRMRPRRSDPIVALAGKGGNGGGVLAGARHLLQRGYAVSAVTSEVSAKFKDEAARQVAMFRKEGGSAPPWTAQRRLVTDARLLLDGLIGYGLTESPKGPVAEMIRAANAHAASVVALDLPSGLHPDTGQPSPTTVEADATLALALPKEGLLAPTARPFVGELYLGDIAFPRALYTDLGATPEAIFGDARLVRFGPDEARPGPP